jgi:hypothetical protein
MSLIRPTASLRVMLALLLSFCVCSDALAQTAGTLPVPPECSSSTNLTLPREGHPRHFKPYGKVDLFCGTSSKPVVKGATLCNSDYHAGRPGLKTVTIAVSSKTKSGKPAACKKGADLKFMME